MCLQHHVGYNLVRTRNFCQLIFPCPGARRCAACPRGRQPLPPPGVLRRQRPAVPHAQGWQRSPGARLAGVTGTCPQIALSCCCLFAHMEGSLEGNCVALCLQLFLLQEPSALGN